MGTPLKVDELQKVLFAIASFDQMYEALQEAEKTHSAGRQKIACKAIFDIAALLAG